MNAWRYMFAAVLLATGMGLTGCGEDNSDSPRNEERSTDIPDADNGDSGTNFTDGTKAIRIHPHKGACTTNEAELCLMLQNSQGEATDFLYEPIAGFQYQWGTSYVLRVRPTATGFELVKILSQKRVAPGQSFTLDLDRSYVTETGDCVFSLAEEVSFPTESAEDCRDLRQALDRSESFETTFSFLGGPSPIQAVETRRPQVRDWKVVYAKRILHEPGGSSCSESLFRVYVDGDWEYLKCSQLDSKGQLSSGDLTRLDELAENIASSDLSEKNCTEDVFPHGSHVYMKVDTNQTYQILKADPEEMCIRGDQSAVGSLDELLGQLESEYVDGGTIVPHPGPDPVPLPRVE